MSPEAVGRGVRAAIERLFESWGRTAYRLCGWLLLASAVGSGLLIAQLPRLTFDNSTDEFLRPRDPIRVVYDDFRRRFGRDERMLLAIEGEGVFELDFLAKLRALHEDLREGTPHLEDVTSLVNARNVRGEADELIVEDLMEDWPRGPEDVERLRERARANPLYENVFLSADEKVATISLELVAYSERGAGDVAGRELAGFETGTGPRTDVPFLSAEEISESVRSVRAIVARHQAPGFRIYLAGGPVMSETLNFRMSRDASRGLVLTLLAIGGFLYLLLRRWLAVALPLLIVVLSMLCTLGTMALVGAPMSIATQILPTFLVAVGICDAVHILAIFFRRFEESHDKQEAIAFTLGHSGLAIVMTSLTTAGGLVSFLAADLKPVADLGIWAPIGVLYALVYTLVLMPALIAVLPVRPRGLRPGSNRRDRLDRLLVAMGDFAASRPWSVVVCTAFVLLCSFAGVWQLRFSHNAIEWFPATDELRLGTEFTNARLGGAMSIEILADSGRENGLHEPDMLVRLQAVHDWAVDVRMGDWSVSKTISLVDVVKESHRALNENRPDFYMIPGERDLVAQELLLFENSGSDDLTDLVDPQFRTARLSMRVPWLDAMFYPPIIAELRSELARILGPDVKLEVTGLLSVLARTFRATIQSMARSYVIALAVITPLMILLIGDVRRGVLSMVPNLTPVIMTLGFMGWVGLPIDGSNLMVGSIVIGLAVDDTIHFMHNFRRYWEQSGDPRRAVQETLQTTGRALLLTSLVLAAGFYTFTVSYMKNLVVFGALTGSAIAVAFLANVLLASALMVLATRRVVRPERDALSARRAA